MTHTTFNELRPHNIVFDSEGIEQDFEIPVPGEFFLEKFRKLVEKNYLGRRESIKLRRLRIGRTFVVSWVLTTTNPFAILLRFSCGLTKKIKEKTTAHRCTYNNGAHLRINRRVYFHRVILLL